MGYPRWLSGDQPTPEDLNGLILSARKTVTEPLASSSTMQNDDELFVAVEASAVYRVELFLLSDSGTAGRLKIGWAAPSGASLAWAVLGPTTAESTNTAIASLNMQTRTTTEVASLGGSTSTGVLALAFGTLIVGSTAGNLQFQWAQNALSVTNTNVRAGSHLLLTRIA
ncbi:hypothetical protein ACFYPC_08780 [Streptomyces sp. NPDC005808]|uniref:hypothetical protein n=1 Tax=Streptomyces sp. NPDC005808 TaxID=3364734 RepID=UPI0036893E9E